MVLDVISDDNVLVIASRPKSLVWILVSTDIEFCLPLQNNTIQ